MNAAILFLLAVSRSYAVGVLRCTGLAVEVAPPIWVGPSTARRGCTVRQMTDEERAAEAAHKRGAYARAAR